MSPKNRLLFACLDLIRRRLILKRLLVNLVLLGYIGLFFFLCIKLLIEPDQIHSSIIYLLVGFVGAGLTWILVLRVRKSYSQIDAANVIDRNCNLHDQIKSATWFINNNIDTVFTKVVISDSERVIRSIDAEKVVPINMTQFLLKLAFLVISFTVVGFSVNGFPKELKQKMFSYNSSLNNSIAVNPLDLESLNSEYVNIVERVKNAREEGSPPEKVTRINQDLREMMDEANLRAIMARDGMAELAKALEGREEYEEVIAALKDERLDDAASLLSEINEQMDDEADINNPQVEKKDIDAIPSDKDFFDDIEDVSATLGELSTNVNQNALERAIASIEDAQSMLDEQQELRQLDNWANQMEEGSLPDQLSPLTPARFGDSSSTEEPASAGQSASSRQEAGTMFRQGALARGEGDEDSMEGYEAGSSSGDSEAEPVEGNMVSRVPVSLELKSLILNDADYNGEDDGEKTWFYSPTKKQNETTTFNSARSPQNYSSVDVIERKRTPVRQKTIIKNYFINIHEKGN